MISRHSGGIKKLPFAASLDHALLVDLNMNFFFSLVQ